MAQCAHGLRFRRSFRVTRRAPGSGFMSLRNVALLAVVLSVIAVLAFMLVQDQRWRRQAELRRVVEEEAAFRAKMERGRALIDKPIAKIVEEARARDQLQSQAKAQRDERTDWVKQNADWFRRHGLPENATDEQVAAEMARDICRWIPCKDVPPVRM